MNGSPVVAGLKRSAAAFGALAAALSVVIVVVFGWSPASTATGAAAGTVIWGLVYFFSAVQREVPDGDVEAAPVDLVLGAASRSGWRRALSVMVALALLAAMTWLADKWDLGGAFIPGQFAGDAAACALGAVIARRWEINHQARLVSTVDANNATLLYALPAG